MNNIHFHKDMPTDVPMQYCHDSDDPVIKVLAAGYEPPADDDIDELNAEVSQLKTKIDELKIEIAKNEYKGKRAHALSTVLNIVRPYINVNHKSRISEELKLNNLEEYVNYV